MTRRSLKAPTTKTRSLVPKSQKSRRGRRWTGTENMFPEGQKQNKERPRSQRHPPRGTTGYRKMEPPPRTRPQHPDPVPPQTGKETSTRRTPSHEQSAEGFRQRPRVGHAMFLNTGHTEEGSHRTIISTAAITVYTTGHATRTWSLATTWRNVTTLIRPQTPGTGTGRGT